MSVATDLARPVPQLGRAKPLRLPSVADQVLDNGLRVLAVRRRGVPLAELRLRIPFAAPSGKGGQGHVARATLLSETLLSGTDRRDAERIASDVQALGGQLSTHVDSDRLAFGGSVLVDGLPGLLELLGEVLTSAAYPKREVEGERDRLVQELAIYRSSAGVTAREALLHQMYRGHPYGRDLPTQDEVAQVSVPALRRLHESRVSPQESVLVLVGDVQPAKAVGLVEEALSGWRAADRAPQVPPLPEPKPGHALLLDRPGAVQTTFRAGAPAPSRDADDAPAFVLANLVFGGYFSSRWVANIREDKGYTYSPHSLVEHPPAGSRVMLSADVATPTTAAALVETWHELGRVATQPVGQDELDQARRYAVGTLALSTASQAGLATVLSQLAAAGLGLDWVREQPKRLAAVTVEDVLRAGERYLAPQRMSTVLVGDVDQVADAVSGIIPVESRRDPSASGTRA